MAKSNSAIAAIAEAIISTLRTAIQMEDEFPGAEISLYLASDFQKPMNLGISLYLYQVTPNAAVRNLPGRFDPSGIRRPPSLNVDLHFLLSVWTPNGNRQLRLLGWAIRRLAYSPILPAELLNIAANDPAAFSVDEPVELVIEPLPLQEINYIWEGLQKPPQLSFGYVARGVALD